MFQSTKMRMRALLELVDEALATPEQAPAPHPHRRPVRVRIDRRVGSVPARPMHCVSPVRPPAERERDHKQVR